MNTNLDWSHVDYALEQTLRAQLASKEKLLWTVQPRRGLRLRPTDALFIRFSLLWCGLAIYWEVSVLKEGAPAFFALWGIPFVGVGIYVVLGRFFVDAASRARTYYALTDERVIIIISGLVNRQTKSLPLRTLSDVTLTERADGSGTITLGLSTGMYGWFAGSGWPGTGRYQPPAFDMIEDARRVYGLRREAQSRRDSTNS